MVRVAFPFEGYRVGGSHISGLTLAEALCEFEGIDTHVVLHQRGLLEPHVKQRQVGASELLLTSFTGRSMSKWNYLKCLATDVRSMTRWLRAGKFDLVHTNDSPMHVTWGVAARRAGIPHVWHQRGTKWPRTPFNDFASTAVVAISDYVLDSLPVVGAAEVMRSYNAVDVPPSICENRRASRQGLAQELDLGENVPLVGFVSNLRDYKRPEFFLRVAASVTRDGVHFVVAGNDYDIRQAELKNLATVLGIEDRTHFLGFRHDSLSLIASLDVLVVPAENEPLGRTPVESVLAGTPVVASRSGGHIESLSGDLERYLVDADDVAEFASRIDDVLADPAGHAREVASAIPAMRSRFSVEAHAREVAQLYGRMRRLRLDNAEGS